MKTKFKSLTVNKNVSVMKFEHEDATQTHDIIHELECIAVLNGGYNQYGRQINIGRWVELKQQYKELLDEIKELTDSF
jgi:hypothetical protein